MISEKLLNFWIKNGYNVLFKGKHGSGKSSIILKAFEDNNLKWQYFSASTMDPWVDFIGVPKEKVDENGNSYLDLIRPKHFQNDEVEAIFLDEFNRSSKKIKNAVMELIQFKSINGKKFNNLKIIWAAINPDDEEGENKYDVEPIDPAQLDRFHVQFEVPYKPDLVYFSKKYGKLMARSAISWWDGLNPELKNLISPRRLDYALDMYNKGGDIKYVLPKQSNISKLILEITNGPIEDTLNNFIEKNDANGAKAFLNIENNFSNAVNLIVEKDEYIKYYVPLMEKEKIIGLMSKYKKIENHVFSNLDNENYLSIVKELSSSKSSKLSKHAAKIYNNYQKNKNLKETLNNQSINSNLTFTENFFDKIQVYYDNNITFLKDLNKAYGLPALQKINFYNFIKNNMCEDLSENQANLTLKYLYLLIIRSNRPTLNKFTNMENLINHLIKNIINKNGSVKLTTTELSYLKRKYPNILLK